MSDPQNSDSSTTPSASDSSTPNVDASPAAGSPETNLTPPSYSSSAPEPPTYAAAAPAAPQYGTPAEPAYAAPQYGAAGAAPQYGAAPGYAAPGYGYAGYAPPKTNTLAIISMIASILGFILILPFIGSLAGVIMGHISLGQIKKTGEGGRGMALAGTIVGWIGLAGVIIFGIIIWIAIAAGVAASTQYGVS